MWQNNVSARSYGFETTGTFKLTRDWRFFASYSLFEIDVTGDSITQIGGSSPHNKIYLRSTWDLGRNVQFDAIGRDVGRVTELGVPKYFEMDTRIGRQATKTLEFSFVGQNLLDGHHAEFGKSI